MFVWPARVRLGAHTGYPVIQFIFQGIAIRIVIGNLLADIAYAVIDSRITYEDAE